MTFGTSLRSLAAVLLLASVACAGQDTRRETPDSRPVVIDDAGDTVRLAHPATRVVSLIPATTELLFAIGAGPLVVGRTVWCDYPPAAQVVPVVGDGIMPNIERVLAQRPDLVVLYRSGQNTQAVEQLRKLGVAAMQVRTDRLSDVPRVARLLGQLTGRDRSADSLSAAFADSLAAATQPARAHPVRAFLLVWPDPPMTVGRGSYLTELLTRAGGENVYDDLPASSGQISVESAVDRNPDVVLVLGDSLPAFARRPEWQTVPAVRHRRFVYAHGSQFAQPSPRSPAAIRELAALLDQAPR